MKTKDSKTKATKVTKATKAKVSGQAPKPNRKKTESPAKAAKAQTKAKSPVSKKAASTQKTSRAGRSAKRPQSKKSSAPTRAVSFASALKVYETALKLMQAESYEKARAKFGELIERFSSEAELVDRSSLLVQACDKRIRSMRSTGPKLKTSDDFYYVAIGEMNSRQFEAALDHLQSALKRDPEAEHVLYAIAAASARSDQREDALEYLQKAIQFRDQNRYSADNDSDFESLFDDADFIRLIRPEQS